MEDGSTRMERVETLDGRLETRSQSRIVRFVMAITGLLLLRFLGNLAAGYLLGYRRPCTLRIDDEGLLLDSRTCLLGRDLSSRSARMPPWSLESVALEKRFRIAPVLVGALFLVLGAVLGFAFLVEWAWTRFGIYLIISAALLALGIAGDLVAVYLVPSAGRKTAIVIRTRSGRIRVTDVDDGAASRFMDDSVRRIGEWRDRSSSSSSREGPGGRAG